LLALCYGGALAGVETTLGPKIAENRRNETYDVIPRLVTGAEKDRTIELTVSAKDGQPRRVYRACNAEGTQVGWVVPAVGQGFADRIQVLVGLDPSVSRVTGLFVLDQKETPGLGDYITGEPFQNRFQNVPTSPALVVVKSDPAAPNEILAITGATISSESVAQIVNQTVTSLREALRREVASE